MAVWRRMFRQNRDNRKTAQITRHALSTKLKIRYAATTTRSHRVNPHGMASTLITSTKHSPAVPNIKSAAVVFELRTYQ
jgi:hypothetical protein